MATLVLKLTDAGLAAVQAASGSDPTVISSLGLSATPFDYAPTLEALPGEFKRVDVASGVASAANVTHLTAYDTSDDVWTATGFGLFLDDGTLFAVHTGAEPVMSKVGLAFALLAFDIAFEADFAANIAYGNAVFAYPAATEDVAGVAEIATQAEVLTGEDDRRFVTPKTLAGRLASFLQSFAEEVQTRISNVADLWDAINAEIGARIAADNGLQAQIDTKLAANNYTAGDVLVKLRSVDGDGSDLNADLLDGYHGAAYDRVVERNFTENGGYEVFASGKKVTWGTFNVAENATVTYNMPVAHTAWVNPTLAISTVAGNTSIQDNTGIAGINVDANGAPTGLRIWNADDRTVTVWIRTLGV
ncbi:hypothetical protein QUC32_13020 [Novosphingobium resinovorum]|uniref:hypothetical protein n=1 Tax=Novosphingobium TaxID=165696 RepID=UPI001B3C908C|nr:MULTISPECIES: hypothetical protein [Novosphingobium]MBF7010599.1 hypothetical protein [Novosphingobium sp. HR1a]WJM28596.1 hypothetical protein QUC32_13020 [Novosphingobium resinovorum]